MSIRKVFYSILALAAAFAITAYGGTLTVKFGSAMEVIEGGVTNTYAQNATFTPTAIPCIYMMRPANMAEGERTFAVFGTDKFTDYNHMRVPQYGDGNWVRVALDPYPESDTTVTLTGYKTSNFYYVDEKNGDVAYDGTAAIHEEGTSHGPKPTLQAAHDAATGDYPIVFVAPGVYSNGVTTTYTDSGHLLDGSSGACQRRLVLTKQIGFVATGGADKTFIVGEPDPETGGVGANAVGGVYASPSTSSYCFLQGFTITGCYSIENQTTTLHYGTAFCSGGYRSYVLDCMISNNVAKVDPATSWSVVKRTKILNNKSEKWVVRYGNFIASVFARNQISSGNGYNNDNAVCNGTANYYVCTFNLQNDLQPSGRQRLHNTQDQNIRGCLVYGITDKRITSLDVWSDGLAIDEPYFANVSRNDYRLGMQSPAMDALDYGEMAARLRGFLTSDVDGRFPVLHDGKLPIGAIWRNEPEALYVDGANGDDANDGTALSHAKATIRGATSVAAGGDTVFVAPGTYGALEETQTVGSTGASRVVVPAGVMLESTGGADVTYIVGAEATGDQIDNATHKTGTNGVRCVYANSGAVVRGFTLTGGRAIGVGAADGKGRGSAFFSAGVRTAVIEDCIVSNNAAYMGTIYQADVRRCRVFENVGVGSSGAAGYACGWYGSIIDKNTGISTLAYSGAIENCTIGSGNVVENSTDSPQVLYWYGDADKAIVNTAVLDGRYYIGGGGKLYCTNCLVMDNQIGSALKREQSYNTIFTNSSAAKVDSEYRPKLGEFVGIDKGDASVASDALGNTDIYKAPRILNGAIDIGAVEYDWRPTFAAELGRRFTMTYASPTVTTNATGGVKLDGDIGALGDRALPVCIAGTVNEAGPYAFTFALSGGSAAVYVGGVLAGAASGAGEQSIRFNVPDAAAEIRFTFTPDAETPGAAILRKFAGARGFSISFR